MPEALATFVAIPAGLVLGGLFYGGLWWTVRQAAHFRRPALAVLASALLRSVAVLGGFYGVGGAEWSRWLLCLLGFLIARLAVTGLTRLPPATTSPAARHAP
jgi:F1F0 ATPase subunit 2